MKLRHATANHNFKWAKSTYMCKIRIKTYDNQAN